jgi:hypothetical protein
VIVGQGLGFVLGGAAASRFSPASVIAVAAAAGALFALLLSRRWRVMTTTASVAQGPSPAEDPG